MPETCDPCIRALGHRHAHDRLRPHGSVRRRDEGPGPAALCAPPGSWTSRTPSRRIGPPRQGSGWGGRFDISRQAPCTSPSWIRGSAVHGTSPFSRATGTFSWRRTMACWRGHRTLASAPVLRHLDRGRPAVAGHRTSRAPPSMAATSLRRSRQSSPPAPRAGRPGPAWSPSSAAGWIDDPTGARAGHRGRRHDRPLRQPADQHRCGLLLGIANPVVAGGRPRNPPAAHLCGRPAWRLPGPDEFLRRAGGGPGRTERGRRAWGSTGALRWSSSTRAAPDRSGACPGGTSHGAGQSHRSGRCAEASALQRNTNRLRCKSDPCIVRSLVPANMRAAH